MPSSSFLILPVEICHNIFDYLDTSTILHTLSPVCIELYESIKTYNRFKFKSSSLNKSNKKLVEGLIKPENIVSLALVDDDRSESLQSSSFLSWFQIDQLTRLKSLILAELPNNLLNQFVQHIRKTNLRCLSISFGRQQSSSSLTILNNLSTAITQFGLNSLHLNISNVNNITILEIPQSVLVVLRHLTMHTVKYDEYHDILSDCIHLQVFVMKDCTVENSDLLNTPSNIRPSYRQLMSLTINGCFLPGDKLRFILSLTPSLNHLTIIRLGIYEETTYESRRWELFLRNELPSLSELQICFIYNVHSNRHTFWTPQSLIETFKTHFWLNDKRWLVTCDYILISSRIIIYTIPIRTNDDEVIIRYDASPLSEDCRLVTRHWLNTGDYIETEETLTSLTLREYSIMYDGVHIFAEALKNNQTLKTLCFENNKIDRGLIPYVLQAIAMNRTLTTVNIGCSQIGISEAEDVNEMLLRNSQLISVNLRNNQIADQGIKFIANALKINKTLKILSLEQNGIGLEGAKYLAEALCDNKTLITLLLQSNTFGDNGARLIQIC